MLRMLRLSCLLAALIGVVGFETAYAQATKTAAPSGFRKMAAGVEITIAPKPEADDTMSLHKFSEMLAQLPGGDADWTPNYEPNTATLKSMATGNDGTRKGAGPGMMFHSDVWYLEFTFRPLRTIGVDIPKADGRMERKVVWYMIYKVKNLGNHMRPVTKDDPQDKDSPDKMREETTVAFVDHPVFWFPKFTLESKIQDKKTGETIELKYDDHVMPLAIDAIRKKEDPKRLLLNCVEMSKAQVKVSTDTEDNSVYGVACWEDVDLRIDFFSVFVHGLTNAYRWADPVAGVKPDDKIAAGRKYKYKELQLNFWRPGDEFHPNTQDFYYGIPGEVDFRWIYR